MATPTQRRIAHDAAVLFDAFTTLRAEHLASGKPACGLLDLLTAAGPGVLDRLGWRDPVPGARHRSQATFTAAVKLARDRLMDEVYSAVNPSIRPKPLAVRQFIRAMVGDPRVATAESRRRLAPAEVRFIRREYRPGRGSPTNCTTLAKLFGVNTGLIHQVVNRISYMDVPDED